MRTITLKFVGGANRRFEFRPIETLDGEQVRGLEYGQLVAVGPAEANRLLGMQGKFVKVHDSADVVTPSVPEPAPVPSPSPAPAVKEDKTEAEDSITVSPEEKKPSKRN